MIVIYGLLGIFEFAYFLEHGGSLALMLTISFFTNAYMAKKLEELTKDK